MRLKYTKNFLKHYQKRIRQNSSLNQKFEERLALFLEDPQNEILKNHKLTGTKKYFHAFSVTGDIRVIYQPGQYYIILIDIGTHNPVY